MWFVVNHLHCLRPQSKRSTSTITPFMTNYMRQGDKQRAPGRKFSVSVEERKMESRMGRPRESAPDGAAKSQEMEEKMRRKAKAEIKISMSWRGKLRLGGDPAWGFLAVACLGKACQQRSILLAGPRLAAHGPSLAFRRSSP